MSLITDVMLYTSTKHVQSTTSPEAKHKNCNPNWRKKLCMAHKDAPRDGEVKLTGSHANISFLLLMFAC